MAVAHSTFNITAAMADDNTSNSFSKRIGGGMMFVAWIAFIAFLAYSFNQLIGIQTNPNQSVSTSMVAGSKQVVLERNRAGHYVTNGTINNQPVVFLLDTGATNVALSSKLAQKLNLQIGRPFKVSTANGITTAYRTRLKSVSIGEITLYDVPASILNNSIENQVLLGMAFLKQLELIQKGEQLTIRQ